MLKYFVVLMLLCCTACAWEDKSVAGQKFKVTYSVTYNAITLERAAELERLIKQFCKDACTVLTDVNKVDEVMYLYGGDTTTIPNYVITDISDADVLIGETKEDLE